MPGKRLSGREEALRWNPRWTNADHDLIAEHLDRLAVTEYWESAGGGCVRCVDAHGVGVMCLYPGYITFASGLAPSDPPAAQENGIGLSTFRSRRRLPDVSTIVDVDTTFDVRQDAGGRDPDSHSPTLRRYHQLLWSKPLPSGAAFDLDPGLHHASELGDYWLRSDGIVHTFKEWTRPRRLVEIRAQVPPAEVQHADDVAHTIGGYIVFPTATWSPEGRVQQSINQRRGMLAIIRDRFDLTLECIRRHYVGAGSPLQDVLARHADFFSLFEDFRGYVDHFLLQDLVEPDYSSVRFWSDFDDFATDPLPARDLQEYRTYLGRCVEFLHARNRRIASV